MNKRNQDKFRVLLLVLYVVIDDGNNVKKCRWKAANASVVMLLAVGDTQEKLLLSAAEDLY